MTELLGGRDGGWQWYGEGGQRERDGEVDLDEGNKIS